MVKLNDELVETRQNLQQIEEKQVAADKLKEYLALLKLDAEKDSVEQRKMLVKRFKTINSDEGLTISEFEFRNYLAKNPDKFNLKIFKMMQVMIKNLLF